MLVNYDRRSYYYLYIIHEFQLNIMKYISPIYCYCVCVLSVLVGYKYSGRGVLVAGRLEGGAEKLPLLLFYLLNLCS